MVRRWSYLKLNVNGNFDRGSKSLDASFENHTFKVFKKTTFFRKYNRGIASFVRRKNILRKRKTNNVILTFIASKWVSFYLRLRRLCRYAQAKYSLPIANSLSSVEAFVQKSRITGYSSGVLMTTVPKKMCAANLTPKFKNTRNALIYAPYRLSSEDQQVTGLLFNAYQCDKHNFYRLSEFNPLQVMNDTSTVLSKHALNISVSVRRLITLCTLLNILK
jgi:hypothetical protein